MVDGPALNGHCKGGLWKEALGAQHKLVAKSSYETLKVRRSVSAVHSALTRDFVRLFYTSVGREEGSTGN